MRAPPPPARPTRRLAALAAAALLACDGGSTPVAPPGPMPLERPFALHVAAGDGQRAFAGDLLPEFVVVEVRDRTGRPAAGVTVRFTVTSGGGSVSDSTVLASFTGTVGTLWRLGPTPGRQELAASVVGDAATPAIATASAVSREDADLIVVSQGKAGRVTIVVIDSADFETYRLDLPDTVAQLLPRVQGLAVVAFAGGRTPALAVRPFGPGRDTVRLALAPPFPIPLTIWVLERFPQHADLARGDVALAADLWATQRFGLEPGPLRLEDATTHADQPITCQTAGDVGFDSTAINVYYATAAQIAPFAGVACSARVILIRPQTRPSLLLAHELGHTFGLGHSSDAGNFMHPQFFGPVATTGQVFLSHFSQWSALNAVYGRHPPEHWCERGWDTDPPTAFCLPHTFVGW